MFKCIIGIDQTGAVDKNGLPKPLFCSALYKGKLHYPQSPLYVLSEECLITSFPFLAELRKSEVLILLDCVLGLPQSLYEGWGFESFEQFLSLVPHEEYYGREPASQFFEDLSSMMDWPDGKWDKRRAEIKAEANSVFQKYPFQKNIQTGTYRLWKELLKNFDDFYLAQLELSPRGIRDKFTLLEAYPSLAWRQVFACSRKPAQLRELINKKFPEIELDQTLQHIDFAKAPDLADSILLCLQTQVKKGPAIERVNKELLRREGWIFGLNI